MNKDFNKEDHQKLGKILNKKITQYLSAVAEQNPNLIAAWLFGSYARNQAHYESDIDIALIIDGLDDSEKFDIQVKLMMIASNIDSRIEPHPLSTKDVETNNPFFLEIKKTGIEIPVKRT